MARREELWANVLFGCALRMPLLSGLPLVSGTTGSLFVLVYHITRPKQNKAKRGKTRSRTEKQDIIIVICHNCLGTYLINKLPRSPASSSSDLPPSGSITH